MSERKEELVIQMKRQNKISNFLDNYFHFIEKGSTMSKEVKAGMSVFFISVCALFMNIQIVMTAFADDIPYCGLYLGATITAFIGTLLMGVVCNLPLVQTASLSMSTVMISLLGANSGLSYANLLAVTLVAAVVYLIVMSVPTFRKFIYQLLPESVRCALPVAMGLYIIYIALNNMGMIDGMSLASFSNEALGGATVAPYMRFCIIAGLISGALVLFNMKRKSERPVFSGFLTATLIFFLIASIIGGITFTYVYTQNRIWIGVNPDPLGEMYTIVLGAKELQLGTVFKEGFDFSGFTAAGGNVIGLFVRSILMFVFMGMYESEASAQGADVNGTLFKAENYEKKVGKILFVNAVTNVIAPVLGATPISVAKQSSAATTDGGKTGLSSVVCAIGYLVSMFTWIPFVIFATYTKSVPEYGHAGFVFPNVIYAIFQIADAVMLILGLQMLRGLKSLKEMEIGEIMPYTVTIVMTLFTKNIAYGVACGCVVYVLMVISGVNKKEIFSVSISKYIMAILSIVLLAISLIVPTIGSDVADTERTEETNDSVETIENTNGFTFDETTGEFAFIGNAETDYYTIWVYALDEEGNEEGSYVAASSRLSGDGEITGTVDISSLPFGNYHANLLAFQSDGSNAEPIIQEFSVTGKLSAPEFKYTQDGTSVKITLYSGTLTIYNEKELFTDIDINIYNEKGEVVKTETIVDTDLVASAMGPMTSYSCEKNILLDAGTYEISLVAKGDGKLAEASDESEKLELIVSDGTSTEKMTSGYVEESAHNGMMP